MNQPLPFSLGRTGVIAGNAFLEAVRQRVFLFVTLFAGVLVAGSLGLRGLNFGGSEARFVADFGQGALVLFGSILTIVTSVQLLGGELEHRTVLAVLAKPVRRSEFVCGKFLGVWLVAFVFCALVTALLVFVLWVRMPASPLVGEAPVPSEGMVPLEAVALFGVLQVVKFGLLTAMVLLIGSFAQTNVFALATSFLVLVICHLQYLARDAWQADHGWGERVGAGLIGLVFPNFQLFGSGYLDAGGTVLVAEAGRISLYGFAYTAVFLGLAVWSFHRREI